MPVRYCQIAIFQGFRVAIPGRESGLKKSRLGGGEMAVLECLLATMNLRPETTCNLRPSVSFNLRPSASICD
jgi:hypothetical protein